MLKKIFFVLLVFNFKLFADTNLFNAALQFYNSKDYKNAKKYFEKYIFLYPDDDLTFKAYQYILNIFQINKDYNSQLKYLNKILKLFPEKIDLPVYYRKIADLYFQTGKYEKALQYYNLILIKFPDSPEAYYALIKKEELVEIISSQE
jgi:TolA-binding protein